MVPSQPTSPHFQKDDRDEESVIPAWISLWGLVAFGLGIVGLLTAQLVGSWLVTVTLAVFGVAAVCYGIVATRGQRKTRDRLWFSLGGVLCGSVLLVALFAPGLLNTTWPTDRAVAVNDPNKLEVVARQKPHQERIPLGEGEWADAETQAIRQENALVRLESVKAGPLSGKGETSYLLIHFRLVNLGRETNIPLEAFDHQNHQPILKDASGRTFPFLEQRPRKVARGPLEFEEPSTQTQSVSTTGADLLLVFELPPAGVLHLELPTSAWGRKGMCRFQIARFFTSSDKK